MLVLHRSAVSSVVTSLFLMSLAKEKIPILSAIKMPIYFTFQREIKVSESLQVLLFQYVQVAPGRPSCLH